MTRRCSNRAPSLPLLPGAIGFGIILSAHYAKASVAWQLYFCAASATISAATAFAGMHLVNETVDNFKTRLGSVLAGAGILMLVTNTVWGLSASLLWVLHRLGAV